MITAGQGALRHTTSLIDNFVLTRLVNLPEIIFNIPQRSNWTLSQQNQCYICDKNRYTAIIFNSKKSSPYTEITDNNLIQFLNLNLNLQKNIDAKPQIFGTITGSWRKVAQLQDIEGYALLSIVYSQRLNDINYKISECIQNGLNALHKLKINDLKHVLLSEEQLKGCNLILQDKLTDNALMDITCINAPTHLFQQEIEPDTFIYNDIIPAGHHQFIIYSPQMDTFWYKEFVLDINHKDFHVDLPTSDTNILRLNRFKENKQKFQQIKEDVDELNKDEEGTIQQDDTNNNLNLQKKD